MAYLTFTDAAGDAVLECLAPRFHGYTIDVAVAGEHDASLGTGYLQEVSARADRLVALAVAHMEADDLTIALRCKVHLLGGGTICVYTEDLDANVYECRLAPGQTPQVEGPDPETVLYTLRLPLAHVSATGATATEAPAIYERDGRTRQTVTLSGCVWIT